jgi:hypothetical protein
MRWPIAAIRYFHKMEGLPIPTDHEAVKATLRGICRSVGSAKSRKTPALAEQVKAMVAATVLWAFSNLERGPGAPAPPS